MKIITLIYLFFVCEYNCLMLKNECLHDEVHKSCSFYEEYTCWETERLNKRVKSTPKRLAHCRAGCYCKKGMVRAYPHGSCIVMMICRNLELQAVLNKIPAEFSNT